MKFISDNKLENSAPYLLRLLDLIGVDLWNKRVVRLAENVYDSPYLAKIVADYHWLEIELNALSLFYETDSGLSKSSLTTRSDSALQFAMTVVEVHNRLSAPGKKILIGRLRDGLRAETGFASLYQEMEISHMLMSQGFDIDLPDFNGTEQCDVIFSKDGTVGQIECKSLSADAGRKIHRKEFYRFIDSLRKFTATTVAQPNSDIYLFTLDDRFPVDFTRQEAMRSALKNLITSRDTSEVTGNFFHAERLNSESTLGNLRSASLDRYHDKFKELFGENCHVASIALGNLHDFIAMRSVKEDDTSKPLLDSLKKAITQLKTGRPSIVAVQLLDIEAHDLILPHVRRRLGILSDYLFQSQPVPHIVATYFCAYHPFADANGTTQKPGISLWNSQSQFYSSNALPFRSELSDDQFANLLRRRNQ